jgi:hypothetical protein
MGPVYVQGGFRDSVESRLPESLLVAAEVADELDQRDRERAERAARVRAEELEQNAIRASIVLAQERGEWVDHRAAWRQGGIGRTPSEARAAFLAQQEAEDVKAEWAERAAFEQWRRGRMEGTWADTSAPSEAETAEREQLAARAATRRLEDDLVITARELARLDRERPGWDRQWRGDR